MTRSLQQAKAMSFYIWTGVAFVVTMGATVVFMKTESQVALWIVMIVPAFYMLGYWLGSLYFGRRARVNRN